MIMQIGQVLEGQYTLLSVVTEAEGEALWSAKASWGKVLLTLFSTDETAQGRRIQQSYLRQARSLVQIQHPALLGVTDLLETDGTIGLVHEDRLHQTLGQRYASGPLLPGEVLSLTRILFAALAQAHDQALLHGRITPERLWFDARGQVALARFGLGARALAEARQPIGVPDPRYSAPEQCLSGVFSTQTDIYALAACLFEGLSGRPLPPAQGRQRGIPLPAVPAQTPPTLVRALLLALEVQPSERAVSARAVLEELDAAPKNAPQNIVSTPLPPVVELKPVPVPAPPAPTPLPAAPKRVFSPLPLIAGFATLGILGLAAALWLGRTPAPETLSAQAAAAAQSTPEVAQVLPEPSPTQPSEITAQAATPVTVPVTPDPVNELAAPEPVATAPLVLRSAVIRSAQLNLRAGPSAAQPVQATLARGTSLDVLEDRAGWSRVKTPDQHTGWVNTNLILTLHSEAETQTLLDAVAAGGSVQVASGAYHLSAPLVLPDGLDLQGAGLESTLLFSEAAEDTLIVRSTQAALTGLTVAHIGQVPARTLLIESGAGTLSRVRLTGAVRDEEAQEYGSGVWVTGDAQLKARDTQLIGNAYGLYASDHAVLDIEDSQLSGNTVGGALLKGQTSGTLTRNRVESNQGHGLQLRDAVEATLLENQILKNRQRGLTIHNQSAPVVKRNTFEGNGYQGIGIQDQAAPEVQDNIIQGNGQSGITYFDNAAGQASGNTVQANGKAGIAVTNYASPALTGNILSRNKQNGLSYSDFSGGTAQANTITANINPGIAAWGSAQPTVTGNTVRNNAQSGVVFAEQAAGQISGNVIDGNALYGLIVTGHATPDVEENEVSANKRGGIFYKQSAAGEGQGNRCFGNGGADLGLDLDVGSPGPDFQPGECGN